MAETGAFLEFDTKDEKLKIVKNKIKKGIAGKAKLNNIWMLLARNSEQLKQKISEYFERQRKMIDERETKLLNNVNMFIDCKITEIEDQLKHFQEKLDHLITYQHYLERDELPSDYSMPDDDFYCFVAASRYVFCGKKNDLQSSCKKLGTLRQGDILIARLDSCDEDESDGDIDVCKDASQDSLMKKLNSINKIVEIESSDVASSCSVLSYEEVEEENEENKTKVRKAECVDDYEFLVFEVPIDPLYEQPILHADTTLSTNLNDSEDSKTATIFEREKTIEKMLEAFKNRKANGTDIINKANCQIAAGNKINSMGANEESSLADKVTDSIKICQSGNEQKDASAKALFELKNCFVTLNKVKDCPNQELKTDHLAQIKALRSIDHISNFNSRVEAILNKDCFKMENCIA